MSRNEYDKVFLQIEGIVGERGKLFGAAWDEAGKLQLGFLLARPLILKILTQRVWGPAELPILTTNEWKEVERSKKNEMLNEMTDMAILLLTADIINPDLSLRSQQKLVETIDHQVLGKYCADLGMSRDQLIPRALKKIKFNALRNPPEAYSLIPGEDIETSRHRRDHNWEGLKRHRDKIPAGRPSKDWWKKWLVIDEAGYVREKG